MWSGTARNRTENRRRSPSQGASTCPREPEGRLDAATVHEHANRRALVENLAVVRHRMVAVSLLRQGLLRVFQSVQNLFPFVSCSRAGEPSIPPSPYYSTTPRHQAQATTHLVTGRRGPRVQQLAASDTTASCRPGRASRRRPEGRQERTEAANWRRRAPKSKAFATRRFVVRAVLYAGCLTSSRYAHGLGGLSRAECPCAPSVSSRGSGSVLSTPFALFVSLPRRYELTNTSVGCSCRS